MSGGIPTGAVSGPPIADVMRDFLLGQGIKEADLLVENRSQDTFENAVESAAMLRERGIRRIVLVTDAIRMRRAVLCFRKQEVEVVPSPCNRSVTKFNPEFRNFLPHLGEVDGIERAWHEWAALAYSWLAGRI